jgi:hypothetical protein
VGWEAVMPLRDLTPDDLKVLQAPTQSALPRGLRPLRPEDTAVAPPPAGKSLADLLPQPSMVAPATAAPPPVNLGDLLPKPSVAKPVPTAPSAGMFDIPGAGLDLHAAPINPFAPQAPVQPNFAAPAGPAPLMGGQALTNQAAQADLEQIGRNIASALASGKPLGTIKPLRNATPLDMIQAAGEGLGPDLLGAPSDIYALANNLWYDVLGRAGSAVQSVGKVAGVVPKDKPDLDMSRWMIHDPIGGSQAQKRAFAQLGTMVGITPVNKFDLTPGGRTAYDITENMAGALPLTRASGAARAIERLTPLEVARATSGYAKPLPVATGKDFIQDMAAAAGAGVGQSQAESDPNANPLATIALSLAGAHGAGATTSLAAKPFEIAGAIKRGATPEGSRTLGDVVDSLLGGRKVSADTSYPGPSQTLLDLAGPTRREALVDYTPTQSVMDQAAQVLQDRAINPSAAAAKLEQRAAEARTLGDMVPDSFSASGDEGLISAGTALRSGEGGGEHGAPVPAIFAAHDRRLADKNRADIESLRVPGADQRAPQRLAEDEKTLRIAEAVTARDKAAAKHEAAARAAVDEGTVLASKRGGEASASEEADRVLAATLKRDQEKRSSLYDLGDRGELESADATPLKTVWESLASKHANSVASTRENLLPKSVEGDLGDIFKQTREEAADGSPGPSLGDLQDMFRQAEADAAKGDNVVPFKGKEPSNVVPLRGKQPVEPGEKAPVVPLAPQRGRKLSEDLTRVMLDPEAADVKDGEAAIVHLRQKFKEQADRSPALQKAIDDTMQHLNDGDLPEETAIAEGRKTLTDPEDQRVFDALGELWQSPEDDVTGAASRAMGKFYGDVVAPRTPGVDADIENGVPRVTMKQLQQARANMSKEQKAARDAADFGMVDRLRELKGGIDETVDRFIADNPDSRAAQQLKKAKQFDKDKFSVWMKGAGDKYRKDVNASPEARDKAPPSATLSYFIKEGFKGTAETSGDLASIAARVTDPAKLKNAVRDYFAASAARTVREDGTISATALRAWRDRNAAALSKWPDIRDEFNALARKADSTDAKVSGLAKAMREKQEAFNGTAKDVKEMALSPFLDQEPKKAVAAILNGKDPEVQMRAVLQRIGKDKAARDGLKDALSEHLYDRVTGSNAAAGQEGVAVSASKMLNQIDRFGSVLKQVYTSEEMGTIERVQRTLRDMQATAVRAGRGSTTVDRFAAAKNSIEALIRLKHGALEGGSIVKRFRLMLNMIPGVSTEEKVNRVLLTAAFDPQLAADLLRRPPQPEGMKLFATQISNRMAALAGLREEFDDDQEQEDAAKR